MRATAAQGVSVTGVSVRVLRAQSGRDYLAIQNRDAVNSVWYGIGKPATADYQSLEIPAMSTWEPLKAPREEIHLVAAAGVSVNVNVTEGVEHD